MNTIDADKLIVEIERLKKQLISGACAAQINMETSCKEEAYNEVLSCINSLKKEQPLTIEKVVKQCKKFGGNTEVIQPEMDLEKAADNYSRKLDYYHYTSDDPAVAFKAGAEWQKNKMLEEAVDGEVEEVITYREPNPFLAVSAPCPKGFKDEEKVKVIIMKKS